ncbi:alpha/beta fold hydrolase [Streptomyces sp. NPDC058964]|uniref:alpha/beta fold hydrolase n=1 Tax=Streptomyces sp. NPDC058964 TaxID=3346681 RepID=UPI0036CB9DB6
MNMSPVDPSADDGIGGTTSSHRSGGRLSRRAVLGGAAATAAVAAGISLTGGLAEASAAVPSHRTPSGFGAVSTAPNLPAGFKDTFASRLVRAGGIRQHAVVGGDGPPLLLVHGWPQNWYAWRMLMPALAKNFTVIAVDQRGIGLTDKPQTGYDTRTLANDLIALMDALGHRRFAVAGHDTGMVISYALAADHPDRVERVALAEVPGLPGVGGLAASPPLFAPEAFNNRLWHIPFNRVNSNLTEQLVSGREKIYFGYEFAVQGGKLPAWAIEYYVRLYSNPGTLRGSFGFYRAFDATFAQNEERSKTKLAMPVLAIGGAESYGSDVGKAMANAASNVQSVVIPGAAHWVAEQAPQAMLSSLTKFLAPYRAGASSTSLR